jgi:hypothetical protein
MLRLVTAAYLPRGTTTSAEALADIEVKRRIIGLHVVPRGGAGERGRRMMRDGEREDQHVESGSEMPTGDAFIEKYAEKGEIIRRAPRKHECTPPQFGEPGEVWRCYTCGRRYTCVDRDTVRPGVADRAGWRRRYWPWPR